MLTVTQAAKNRIDIELSGQLDAETMRVALDELIDKSEGISSGLMFYRITDFSMPTLGAMAVELSRLPKLFGLIGKFEKCAVLSDAAWLRKVAEVEGALIPGLSIKSFDLSEASAAEQWLAA